MDLENSSQVVCPLKNRASLSKSSGAKTGAPGHVLIKYPSGGSILASATHWIELMKFNVSNDRLFAVARENYGESYVSNIQNEYSQCQSAQDFDCWNSKWSKQIVQQSSPCKMYSPRKKKGY
jgi:hypothetical protein